MPFHFHQTGAKLTKIIPDGQGGYFRKTFEIPREYQHEQARKAGLDYGGGIEVPICLSEMNSYEKHEHVVEKDF